MLLIKKDNSRDSIAISVFVVILVEFDKYWDEQACPNLPSYLLFLKTTHVQAFNGALQSVPAIVVAFFAGPLSDRYARKPFILLSIGGYIILNAIFLINAYWFYELKVQLR